MRMRQADAFLAWVYQRPGARVPMFSMARFQAGRALVYFVRPARVNTLLGQGWAIYVAGAL